MDQNAALTDEGHHQREGVELLQTFQVVDEAVGVWHEVTRPHLHLHAPRRRLLL